MTTITTKNEAPIIVTSQSINGLREKYAFHPFHLTAISPWPFLTALCAFASLTSLALWFNSIDGAGFGFLFGALSALFVLIHWFSDVANEATLMGMHTRIVQQAHAIGVVLFITTEFMFFFAIFWAFFHSALAPTIEMGSMWPPRGVEPLSPILVPLLNTALLISSGAAVTWGHHAFFQNRRSASIIGLTLTLVLALVFTALQAYEYAEADFTIADSVFGSCFYFSTGTHGLHVIVGTLFITVGFVRHLNYALTREHHIGLEASILYWHFVDLVWLFLYLAVYWWTAGLFYIYYLAYK